jgi:hypothetical protein
MRAYNYEDAQALTSWVSWERAAAAMSQMTHGRTHLKYFFDFMVVRA